ncbi:MAG: hypothetical protein IRY99_25560 [Isosphaeraceae bacterium]|nr:hypothetical protein [Isosphaeraceae bacterium]
MTQSDFNNLLSNIETLSPEQMRRLAHELETKLAALPRKRPTPPNGPAAEETAYDVAARAGLIGCIPGMPRSPADLSTNPKHLEGFGRD